MSVERAPRTRALHERKTETHDQLLAFVEKLLGDFDLGEHGSAIERGAFARLFMLARLLSCLQKIWTFARAVQRDLALVPTALRADSSMHRRTEPLFFSYLANRTGHAVFLNSSLFHGETGCVGRATPL